MQLKDAADAFASPALHMIGPLYLNGEVVRRDAALHRTRR
jgi:hypothetical protein